MIPGCSFILNVDTVLRSVGTVVHADIFRHACTVVQAQNGTEYFNVLDCRDCTCAPTTTEVQQEGSSLSRATLYTIILFTGEPCS